MDIQVGAEYVIANALIELRKHGKECITFGQLRNIGWRIQQLCNKEGINAIILTSGSRLTDAIYDFSDYFEYGETDAPLYEPMIRIKNDYPIEDLKDRFVYCLPDNVAKLFSSKMPELVA